MPGPYCYLYSVYRNVQATLGQAADAELPEHWFVTGDRAVKRGYARMVGLLGGRGYSVAAIDTWAGRESYNLDYAVAYAFMYGTFRRDTNGPTPQSELDRIDRELRDKEFLLFDDSGGLITPDITANIGTNVYGSGRLTAHDESEADFSAWGIGSTDDDGTIYEVP